MRSRMASSNGRDSGEDGDADSAGEEDFGVDDVTIVDPSLLKRAVAAAAIGNVVE
jgi:MHS family proline/betaine transporter-like MFS transporter